MENMAGLREALEKAELADLLPRALEWCENEGAKNLEEVAEYFEQFAKDLELKRIPKNRLGRVLQADTGGRCLPGAAAEAAGAQEGASFHTSGASASCAAPSPRGLPAGCGRPAASWEQEDEAWDGEACSPTGDDEAALNEEQNKAVRLAKEGHNVFITGAAGTGKTRALRQVIAALKEKYKRPEKELAICATTGNAACLIHGTTVNFFLGCRLGRTQEDFKWMWKAQARLKSVRTLIIDEVSMMKSDFFDFASDELRKIRKCQQPFGGIQLILCGDFLQLPPVVEGGGEPPFCFKAKVWDALQLKPVVLRHCFRQEGDPAFFNLLQRIRTGQRTDLQRLKEATQGNLKGCEGTKLTCKKKGAEDLNEEELKKLEDHITYTALHRVEVEPATESTERELRERERDLHERMEKDVRAPKELRLALGARVVLLRNLRLPEKCEANQIPLVNGTTGKVVGWAGEGERKLPKVEFSRRDGTRETHVMDRTDFTGEVCGVGKYCRRQLPLDLAWAVTVHKSQGMTLSAGGTVDLTDAFTAGQVYTALSRFSRLSDIRVIGLPSTIRTCKEALEFHRRLEEDLDPTGAIQAGQAASAAAADVRQPPAPRPPIGTQGPQAGTARPSPGAASAAVLLYAPPQRVDQAPVTDSSPSPQPDIAQAALPQALSVDSSRNPQMEFPLQGLTTADRLVD